jgi:TRAP-type mannitol/chloroaromatic compound transport system permease small subunit
METRLQGRAISGTTLRDTRDPKASPLTALLRLSRAIDWTTALIGRAVAWLVLAAVLVSTANAVIRKAIDLSPTGALLRWYIQSSNSWLEMQWYLFSAVFLLAAAYTLQRNEHIRIDIISGRLSKNTRNWIDLFGHFFMLTPFVVLMIYELVPYVSASYRNGERSANSGGLVIWPVKALMLAGFLLLFLQAVSEIIKRIAVMRGVIPEPLPEHHAHPGAEGQIGLREPGA